MLAVRVRLAIAVVVAGLALAACDDPKTELGFLIDEQGRLVILYDPCSRDSTAESVQLENSEGTVLWRIEAMDRRATREFVAGDEPDGFSTSVPLIVDIRGMRLRVEVSGIGPQYFDLSELDRQRVFVVGDGLKTRDEFLAREKCEGGWFT